jgi:putative sigma-54 modulation protein
MLHGVGRHARVDSAVSGAVKKVDQQAQRLADRWKTRRRVARKTAPREVKTEAAPAASEAMHRIIRSRRYAVKPMAVEDAALSLSAGDRPFLVFRHASSGAVAVLYRRPDGHFGLIEPEA